jgi:hypothetical protein
MIKPRTPLETAAQVAVLFPPDAVSVIDIFRALGDFEDHYDITALDQLETRLADAMSEDDAKCIVSDALLLAFSLRRERCEPLEFAPIRSRRGTLDEYRLMALVGATYWHDFDLAADAAASLKVVHHQPLVALAFDIARRLETAGLRIECPDPRMFTRPRSDSAVELKDDGFLSSDLKLTFDV